MDRIAEIPAVLIHGRYDVSGPLDMGPPPRLAASRRVVLEDAGHGGASMTPASLDDRGETGRVGDTAGLELVVNGDHVVAWVLRKRWNRPRMMRTTIAAAAMKA